MVRVVQFVVVAGTLLAWSGVSAHLHLVKPASRYGANVLKSPPCGKGGGARTTNVASYRAGETILVEWEEYIDHPSHYRIAFDRDGQDDFVDPACKSGCNSTQPNIEKNSNASVLLDGITDRSGGVYRKHVTLPDVTCEKCTLQVIQVMYDKPPYTLPGNDIYYQCADLKLVPRSSNGDGTSDAGDVGAGADAEPARDTSAGDVEPSWDAREAGAARRDASRRPEDTSDPNEETNLSDQPDSREGGCATTGSSPAGGLPWALGLTLVGLARLVRRIGNRRRPGC